MKKIILTGVLGLILTVSSQAKEVEQTICFSSKGEGYARLATLGDYIPLSGGQCQGRILSEMNKDGWKLIQVVTGLNSAFGMLLTKEK